MDLNRAHRLSWSPFSMTCQAPDHIANVTGLRLLLGGLWGPESEHGLPSPEGEISLCLTHVENNCFESGRQIFDVQRNVSLCSHRTPCHISLSAFAEVSLLSMGRNWLPNIISERIEIGTQYFIIYFVWGSFIP